MKWNKFRLKTTTEAVDFVSGLLAEQGIEGIEVEDNIQLSEEDKKKLYIDILPELPEDDGSAYVTFYMDDGMDKDAAIEGLKKGLEEIKNFVDIGPALIEESVTDDKDWIDNWKQYFKPFAIEDILIKPTWEQADKGGYSMVIDIDPGTSFGTGRHQTTKLCILQLRKYVKENSSLLDVGCGSGILSIIGKKLGADKVIGIDIDENAVNASVENASVNGAEADFFAGDIINDKEIQDKTGYGCYDIVVANILADIIIPLSGVIAQHMRTGGLFIASGIIDSKEKDVVNAIEGNKDLQVKEVTRLGDWVSVTAVKV